MTFYNLFPSHDPGPEAIDIERSYKNGEIDLKIAIFPCAWRPKKYCKGVCDKLGVTENQIVERQDLIDRLNPKYLARKIWICDYSLKGIGGLGEHNKKKNKKKT